MNNPSDNTSCFSSICIEECKGLCCDPWWGIISYTVIKEGGLSNLAGFRTEVFKGILSREQRIREGYVTKESGPRPLFDRPERYNAFIQDVAVRGSSLHISIMAMYAFRCRYLSPEKVCTIHPAMIGGEDIRPPHCGYMGSPDAIPGEKGFCRIIHAAASSPDSTAVTGAIGAEKGASDKHYREGFSSAEEAAENVINQLKSRHVALSGQVVHREKTALPGRNDPCHCGSGLKYKKCHGR